MKQIVAMILIFIALLFTGCNLFDNGSTKYLTQKMDEIQLEFKGYEFNITSSKQTETPRAFGLVTFGDTTIEIKKVITRMMAYTAMNIILSVKIKQFI